jgi:hypothetical protein
MAGCRASTRSSLLPPNDGVGVIALTNGAGRALFWLPTELGRMLHHLLDVPDEIVRNDIPQHPEIWDDICGLYQARVIDLRGRVMMGAGAQVVVRGGQLMLRVLTPVPALYRGIPLHPDDDKDPYVFRIDLSPFGMSTAASCSAAKSGSARRQCTQISDCCLSRGTGQQEPSLVDHRRGWCACGGEHCDGRSSR